MNSPLYIEVIRGVHSPLRLGVQLVPVFVELKNAFMGAV